MKEEAEANAATIRADAVKEAEAAVQESSPTWSVPGRRLKLPSKRR